MATQAPVKTAPAVDLFDPALQQCPYDAYKTLRDEAPAYNIPGTDMWVVSRYDDVRRVLTDPVAFPSAAEDTPFRAGSDTLERALKVEERFARNGVSLAVLGNATGSVSTRRTSS